MAKVTGNEIIKALEYKIKIQCDGCDIKDQECCKTCVFGLAKATLDLIRARNRDNDRLRLENLQMIASIKGLASEAYKEFAERLKCGVPQETGVIRCKDVDFTLTELTERKEDEGE